MSLPDPEALASLLGGELLGAFSGRHPPRTGVIDSRRVQPGDVFFALQGRQVDGHDHVGDAIAAGAALAVVNRQRIPATSPWPRIEVTAPLIALQRLAAWHRRHAVGQVVAITGSNGKTVVKDALTALLASRYRLFHDLLGSVTF